MERAAGFVVNGGIRMPIGYRFHPTDEELVVHYLKRRACGLTLPASVIPELDVFQADPWNLPGDLKENRYFFSRGNGIDYEVGNKRRRVAGFGFWKPTGKERPILASGSTKVVGMRKTLIFRENKHSLRTNIKWVMHKYRLVDSPLDPVQKMGKIQESEKWVVYRVFQRKRKPRKSAATVSENVCGVDFTVEDRSEFSPPQPSSPSSSETTEACSNGFDQEESCSCMNGSCSCMRNL